VNDKVFVRGYGIAKMTWRIYNRWGAVCISKPIACRRWMELTKAAYNHRGLPLCMDVEFSDGVKYQKKGDITLL
jgi:hypothetical protein